MSEMAWRCETCGGECAEEARPYMDRCSGDGPHSWKRIVRGHCAECRAVIYVGESYHSIQERRPVRGRIGYPSGEITGFITDPKIFTCGGCLALRNADVSKSP